MKLNVIHHDLKNLFKWSILSFFIVAILGILMRYKIGFSLPWLNQKFTQYAHSHFAFGGWVTQTIWLFIFSLFFENIRIDIKKKLIIFLKLNLLFSYGMILGFILQGYGFVSITFSSLYLLLNLWITIFLFPKLNKISKCSSNIWFKSAMIFQLISNLGTIGLIFIMSLKINNQFAYLTSIYWYLHFTYNGWFFFACMGLFVNFFEKILNKPVVPKKIFYLFSFSCLPAFGLSILWIKIPIIFYIIIIIAALVQMCALGLLIQYIRNNKIYKEFKNNRLGTFFLSFLGIALFVKFALQLGSVIPSLSHLAFGFRPIVIAYLHLVLLSIISVFLLAYSYWLSWFNNSKSIIFILKLLLLLIFMNQLVLSIQGIASLTYFMIPYINEILLVIALSIAATVGFIFVKVTK